MQGIGGLEVGWILILSLSKSNNNKQEQGKLQSGVVAQRHTKETAVADADEVLDCSSWWCEEGEECRMDKRKATPTCTCREEPCSGEEGRGGGGAAVCGTDGLLYPSICELGRIACLKGDGVLGVNHDPDGCQKDYGHVTGLPRRGETWAHPPIQDNDEDEDEEDSVSYESQEVDETPPLGKGKRGSSLCSKIQFKIFKEALLLYNHEHLAFPKGKGGRVKANLEIVPNEEGAGGGGLLPLGLELNKRELISLIFAHFDKNHDGTLNYEELQKVEFDEDLGRISRFCRTMDFLRFDDGDRDGGISLQELASAFNNLYGTSETEQNERIGGPDCIQLLGKVGGKLEIHCPIESESAGTTVEWKRYSNSLGNDEMVKETNAIGIDQLRPAHGGNFTCAVGHKEQCYHLSVISEPKVQILPHIIVWERPGGSVRFQCRVLQGEPPPLARWLKNEAPLEQIREKYVVEGPLLTIHDIQMSDTGAYMCQGMNEAGAAIDIASLVVMEDFTFPAGSDAQEKNSSLFVLFHDGGISWYDPSSCGMHNEILGSDVIPGTESDYVCGLSSSCNWGGAAKASSTYIYASQPELERLLIISIVEMIVVGLVPTHTTPSNLHYVPSFDQLWIVSEGHGDKKSLQVVKNASEKRGKWKASHISKMWDNSVRSIFLPERDDENQFKHAYLTRTGAGRGLYKIDLRTLKYSKSIDLSAYNCLPRGVHFSSLYGFLIVECHEPVLGLPTGHLVLDILSDAVIGRIPKLNGKSFLSPDSRKLVTISQKGDGESEFYVQKLTQNGLQFHLRVMATMNATNLAFFPSQHVHSYDIFSISNQDDETLFIDLEVGTKRIVPGAGKAEGIVSSDMFGSFVVSMGRDVVFVLNASSHTVNCRVGGVHNVFETIWVET